MSSTQKNTIIVVTLVVAVTLIGAAILFPQPIKSFRSRTLVAESNKLMVKGDWRGAFNKAFSAHRLDQKSYPALGAFFKTAARTNSQYLLRIAAAIVQSMHFPSNNREDRGGQKRFEANSNPNKFLPLNARPLPLLGRLSRVGVKGQ